MSGAERTTAQLLPEIYEELRALARSRLAAGAPMSLQPTQLVHETWLKLSDPTWTWANRAHFLGAASEAMRRVTIDHARRRGSHKRGQGWQRITLSDSEQPQSAQDVDLLALDEVLNQLEQRDPAMANLVKLRFFCGLSMDETARVIGISPRTAARQWESARVWMFHQLESDRDG
jgi:RNA polymerase sigma factor (TIGR02999 family)